MKTSKFAVMAVLSAAALVLTSCGGGGDGNNPTPSPTPTPSPSPSPSPTPTPTNTTLDNLVASQAFATASGRVFTPERGGAVGPDATSSFNAFAQALIFTYDATTGGFILNDATNPPAFLPANKTSEDDTFRTFVNTSGTNNNTSNELVLFKPGANNPRLALSYVSYGQFAATLTNSTTSKDIFRRPFIYGLQAPASGIPTTGTATFTTAVDGYWVRLRSDTNLSQGYADLRLSGTATFTVDFAARTVAVSLQLTGTDLVTTAPTSLGTIPLGTLTGTGTIAASSNVFSGTLSGNGFTGPFSGALFGPTATEAGLAFRVDSGGTSTTTRQHVVGVLVGKRP